MYTLTFPLQKRGVGKTTLAGMLGSVLSIQKYKVLMIDADPQGNLTSWIYGTAIHKELSDVLYGDVSLAEAVETNGDYRILGTNPVTRKLSEWSSAKTMLKPAAFKSLNNAAQEERYEEI